MKRYIDADAFKAWIDEYVSVFKKSDKAEIKGYISHQPSIDICFCKECKFSEVIQNDSSGVMARYCRAFTLPMMKSDDDYCSYGEREGE